MNIAKQLGVGCYKLKSILKKPEVIPKWRNQKRTSLWPVIYIKPPLTVSKKCSEENQHDGRKQAAFAKGSNASQIALYGEGRSGQHT